MLRDMFTQWCTGRLAPRRFAVLWAVIVIALVVAMFFVIAGALTTVSVFKADGSIQAQILVGIGLIGSILLMLAAMFNITVKRDRDIGIPGFVTGVGFLVLFVMGGLSVFLTILLALCPGGSFSKART